MQDLKITLLQVDQAWEDKQGNFNKYEAVFSHLVETDLVLLPEMFHTGFSMNVSALAEDWEDSEGLNFLKKWAKQLDSSIYTSLIIKEGTYYYNRGVFVYPNSEVKCYDKRKSFGLGGEDKFYKAGNDEVIVEWKGWRINLQICYDLRFPELIRNRIEKGVAAYDLLLYVANWPKKRIAHWDVLLRARAIENQCYVVGVNRIGTDGNGLEYCGESACYNALGEKTPFSDVKQLTFETIILNQSDLQKTRQNLPFLIDR